MSSMRGRLRAASRGGFSAVERGALRIECPAWNQVLHRHRVIARAQAVLQVEMVRSFDLDHVELDTEAGLLGHRHETPLDLQRLLGQALPVLPDPMRVDRGDPRRWRTASASAHPPSGSSATRAPGTRSCSAWMAPISSPARKAPPFSLKSLKP